MVLAAFSIDSFFSGISTIFSGGTSFFNFFLSQTINMIAMNPADVSPEAWEYVSTTAYDYFLAIGAVLVNVFCLIGFIRQASDLRQNLTLEICIELFIKVIIANTILSNGVVIANSFFTMSTTMVSLIAPDSFSISVPEVDIGMVFAVLIFGLIFLLVGMVCGIMIFLSVATRILYLYVLVAVSPIAVATIAGGRELENTAIAWIKTFLTVVFQIVVLAMVLKIGSVYMESSIFDVNESFFADWFDGFAAYVNSMVKMVTITVVAKGADSLLKRAFDLR